MEPTKAIILSIATLLALAIIIMFMQFLSRKAKNRNQEDGKMKLSFSLWFISFFFSGSLIVTKTITVYAEAVDYLLKIYPTKSWFESFKSGSLFIGLAIGWLLLWYFVSNRLSAFITGKRNPVHEVEANNYTFFLVRGILLIGITICLLPTFEIVVRAFVPGVQLPFYH